MVRSLLVSGTPPSTGPRGVVVMEMDMDRAPHEVSMQNPGGPVKVMD